mmetsp:Transcript_53819/g.123830  ORF Transcript_53819/g.123830 Transcript_53819/m.123830 type:complete len:211 (+) Transcript_53819:133-765(+)
MLRKWGCDGRATRRGRLPNNVEARNASLTTAAGERRRCAPNAKANTEATPHCLFHEPRLSRGGTCKRPRRGSSNACLRQATPTPRAICCRNTGAVAQEQADQPTTAPAQQLAIPKPKASWRGPTKGVSRMYPRVEKRRGEGRVGGSAHIVSRVSMQQSLRRKGAPSYNCMWFRHESADETWLERSAAAATPRTRKSHPSALRSVARVRRD